MGGLFFAAVCGHIALRGVSILGVNAEKAARLKTLPLS